MHLAVKNKFTDKCNTCCRKPSEDTKKKMEKGQYSAAAYPTSNNDIHLALTKVVESLNNRNMFVYAKSRRGMGIHRSRFPSESCQSLFTLVLEEPLLVTTVI